MNTQIKFDTETLSYAIQYEDQEWRSGKDFRPYIEFEKGVVYFSDAKQIEHKQWKTGVGEGVLSHYEGFELEGKDLNLLKQSSGVNIRQMMLCLN